MPKDNSKVLASASSIAPSTDLSAIAPAQIPQTKTIQEWAADINAAHRRTVADIFETARLCSEAKEKWNGHLKELVSYLDFDYSQFSRYCSAYETQHLRDHWDRLPPSLSTWDALRKLPEPVFKKHIQDNTIHPGTTRAGARKLVLAFSPPKANRKATTASSADDQLQIVNSPSISPNNGPISFHVDWDYEKHRSQEFRDWLDEGRKKFDAKALNRLDDPNLYSIPTDQLGDDSANDEELE
jgi:hypothetical protein